MPTVTQQPGETAADACRRLGWTVGDRLVGDEGYGPTIIRLTAIGEQHVLAVCESHNGLDADSSRESLWTLSCRDWQLAAPDMAQEPA